MPSPETLVAASYALTVLALTGLALAVVLDLRRWARRARKDAEK